jgi:membrane-associated phospholipid phosphatase
VVVGGALRGVLPITAAGTGFPSVETAATAALATSLVAAVTRRGWQAATRAASVAAIAVVVVGMAALVDAASALSGVVGGTGLGSLVALLLEVPSRLPPSDAADASRQAGVQVRGAGR